MEGGLFVTFEGVEGAGKSTQVRLLHEYLSNTSVPFVFTREPGGTPLGEKLRTLLIDPLHQMAPEAEALLLSASRAELVDKIIEPNLREGRMVVCDRFWDATIAYQGFGRGLPIDALMRLTTFAARNLEPDLTFLLDVPVRVSQARIRGRLGFADRMERESLDFHERVAQGYRSLAAAAPARFCVIDGQRDEQNIAIEIRQTVLARWRP
ncbi:MAG TPA: dTMP kinase [Candidatus Eremiobacteraceae bacterium]|nr:dTMP kinase [Candidatus Eremiobacteraceae bacterium]